MSDYERCDRCGKFGWAHSHTCPPAWEVWEVGYHSGWEEAWTVYALDEAAAAEDYAEQSDAGGDYEIIGGKAAKVRVRKRGDESNGELYEVAGDPVPRYLAEKIDE